MRLAWISRARARPDFARPTSRPTPRCFLHTWPGRAKGQRRRRRARAREAIKPNLFSLWMVGITAKRTAIQRTRRRQEGEDFGELLSRAARAEPPLIKRLESWLARRLALPIAGRGDVARSAFPQDRRPTKHAERSGHTNPVQLMPPRFEHEHDDEHENDLVADLGVSSVERSAALRLCGESPSE